MGNIICAIRGGEASRITQIKAINIAKRRDKKLIFLYVISPEVIEKADSHIKEELRDELTFMARLHLRVACHRAREKEVDTGFTIKEGPIKEALKECLKEEEGELLVLGSPMEDHLQKRFIMANLKKFADEIKEETGVEVEIV